MILILVEVVDGEDDECCCHLPHREGTTRAKIVKHPPVVEVSSWSVLILRKKSKYLSMLAGVYQIMRLNPA